MSAPRANWRPFWERVERVFDPSRPAGEAALYAQRPSNYNPIRRLKRQLHRPRQTGAPLRPSRYLVTGTVGNGKTSELYHLGDTITDQRMVVFVELWRHFEQTVRDPGALERLEPWELIGLLGLAVFRAGHDHGHKDWDGADEDFAAALRTLEHGERESPKLNLVELGQGMVVAAGGFVGSLVAGPVASKAIEAGLSLARAAKDATTWNWRIGLRDRKPRQDQEPEIRNLVNAVNRLITKLQLSYARPLALIVDGLDRISSNERLEILFVDSSLLSELHCDVVATAPEVMLHGMSQRVRHFDSIELFNIPVLDHDQPLRPGPGVCFFRELVDKRLATIAAQDRPEHELVPEAPFPDEVVERLAYYSGGVVRDFVRMAQTAAAEAWEANVSSLDLAIVDEILEQYRLWKQSRLTTGEIALLQGVVDDPRHGLPSGDDAIELLRQQRLLPYPNQNPWYYPHPLLTLSLLTPTSKPGSAS